MHSPWTNNSARKPAKGTAVEWKGLMGKKEWIFVIFSTIMFKKKRSVSFQIPYKVVISSQ